MSRREEWQDPGKNSVQRPKHIRPATLHEKLERIKEEIKKIDGKIARYEYSGPQSVTVQTLYDHLRAREKSILDEIGRESADGS